MRQYIGLLQDIYGYGHDRPDRTGVGVRGLFGAQMRFDLSETFPLVTTKQVFWKGVVEELLWFISGSTNINDLAENTRQWWSPWAAEDGGLGPIYGDQLRKSRWWTAVDPVMFTAPEVERRDGLFCGVGEIGETARLRGQPAELLMLKDIWRDMLKRCYDPDSKAYRAYGGAGVHVAPEWLVFDQFAEDARRLPNWLMKLEYPDEFSLDKDIVAASNRYSKDTCMWASREEQSWNTSTSTPFSAVAPDGKEHTFPTLGDAQRAFGLNISAVHRCLHGKLHTHHGWSRFQRLPIDKVFRFRQTDQLKQVLASLKHDPFSRRHVINLWHTPAMDHARLPCCHGSVIQFYVNNGKLSCMMTQRSADMFLGAAINIASYALLTCMIAHVSGFQPGEFIHSIGDAHIYHNHLDQVLEQINRTPKPLPKIKLNPDVKDLFAFTADDVELIGYNPHPKIKGEVAV